MPEEKTLLPKISNFFLLTICGCLLLITFVYGMKMSYELGFYNGGSTVCTPLKLGVDFFGDHVCFNDSEQENNFYYNFPNNTNFSGDFEVVQ